VLEPGQIIQGQLRSPVLAAPTRQTNRTVTLDKHWVDLDDKRRLLTSTRMDYPKLDERTPFKMQT
jgi:hypothetical protein